MMSADVLLFDMDGTLVDSGPVVEECWSVWAGEYGFSAAEVTGALSHGVPARQVARRLLPPGGVPEAVARIEQLEIDRADGLVLLPGTRELLAGLPGDRWAVVTSCTRPLAEARLKAVGIEPSVVVTADDTPHGKPDPAPYVRGARLVGVDPRRCVAFEDAPAGLESARAAGAATVAVTTTSGPDELRDRADVVVADLSGVTVEAGDGALRVHAGPEGR